MNCNSCIFKHKTGNGYEYCGAPGLGFDYSIAERDIGVGKRKPDWCPIKTFPDRKIELFDDGYAIGYNDCLDDIADGNKR